MKKGSVATRAVGTVRGNTAITWKYDKNRSKHTMSCGGRSTDAADAMSAALFLQKTSPRTSRKAQCDLPCFDSAIAAEVATIRNPSPA
jgi:hypothetical protein